ncbi:MAG: tetratricopeptide repeat protein [Bacteroidales bacterium]|nr:tetratricopeptide repeat protein [Bacteroidales bacterium]
MDNKPNQQAPEEPQALTALKNHKKVLLGWSIAVVILCVLALVWYLVSLNGARKADEAVALADIEMNDSTSLAFYQDAAKLGYKSGNRASLQAGIALFRKGDYQEALKYLKDASISSNIVEAGKYSLMGDCYVNLGNTDEALKCYAKALNCADGNTQICPFILIKEANIYRENGMYDREYSCYKEILDKYPTYVQSLKQRNIDLRKYAERAKAAAGK